MFNKLYKIIIDRKSNPISGSYTNQLLDAGYERIAQKVGEEAIEVIIASGNQEKQRTIEEIADLIYHLLVLLVSQGIDIEEVTKELKLRHNPTPEN
jgi:phosphoribosyl-ATP pyrophosphohydrolase